MHLSTILEMASGAASDRVLFGTRDHGLTTGDLASRSRAFAAHVLDSNVHHVAFLGLNSPAFPIALFGAALAGKPLVPLNYRLAAARLEAQLERIAPALVVTDDPDVAPASATRVISADELLSGPESEGELVVPPDDPDAIAVLLFTSGTTGEPKAAVIRHRHLTSYLIATVEFLSAGEDEAALVSVPPYHIAGIAGLLTALYRGRRTVYLPSFSPEDWVRLTQEEGVTHAMVVPTMLDRVLDVLEDKQVDLASLRHVSYGGGRMPVGVIERALERLGHVDWVNSYGLTETSSTIAILSPEDHRVAIASSDPKVRGRLGSVGRPLPSVEIEIRDPEGQPVEPGIEGAIYVRGDQVSGEYVGKGVVTEDGWFPTNDAGRVDADGYLFVEGRLDDVIVRGGENLSPGEIEDCLRANPSVADVAVVGVPDREWGEAVAAVVVCRPGASADQAELQTWVRDRLRSSRTPALIRFADDLPYSETGKLLRRVLREQFAHDLLDEGSPRV